MAYLVLLYEIHSKDFTGLLSGEVTIGDNSICTSKFAWPDKKTQMRISHLLFDVNVILNLCNKDNLSEWPSCDLASVDCALKLGNPTLSVVVGFTILFVFFLL